MIATNSGYKLFKLPHFDDDITSFYKDLFVYKSDSKYGLMDYKGHIVVEPKFDKITIDEPLLAAYIKKIESVDKIMSMYLIILEATYYKLAYRNMG